MTQPTIFLKIESHEGTNPIATVLKHVVEHFGAKVVEQMANDTEADIALTNSAVEACWLANRTQHTSVILMFLTKQERRQAEEVVKDFPGRVSAVPYISFQEGEVEIVPYLIKLFAEKSAS